jgi:hypothetical protein
MMQLHKGNILALFDNEGCCDSSLRGKGTWEQRLSRRVGQTWLGTGAPVRHDVVVLEHDEAIINEII